MLRSPNKPEFAKAIAQACNLEERSTPLPKGIRYIIDGGALLHRIPWAKNERYSEILDHYATYVTQKYPSATIVFDGYDGGATIKDMAQSKRSRIIGREIFFTAGVQLKVKKGWVLVLQEKQGQVYLHVGWLSPINWLRRSPGTG